MGQKTHPTGFRLGIVGEWQSRWYAEKDFPKMLREDETIRGYLRRRLAHAALSKVEIERKPSRIAISLHTARPGVVIGKRGSEVDKLRDELALLTDSSISVNVEEIKQPEIDAYLVAENVAHQLSQRIAYRRAMKRAVQSAVRAGAGGIRIQCSGRLGGAEIARREGYNEGRVPLHTLRADIDYARVPAFTTYGVVGVKCWVFRGEVVEERRGRTYSTGN
ncbi:MAG: 30S ribosomal protein S3 [Gemmatimonadetes bacterium]|nr:30S ribosomal protein S3 [Gemmatimonadota bacterium]